MSRSYKKNPVVTDDTMAKSGKKFANKKVRRTDFDELPIKGSGYKKVYEQYEIRDYKFYWTWEELLRHYHEHPEIYSEYKTEEELYAYWYKTYKAK